VYDFFRKLYQQASRTICGEAAPMGDHEEERTIVVAVSTASAETRSFNITVWLEEKFLMK
jgi:hypothetical protein